MATKSPGVYFTEFDNTQYSNPKAVTGTILAVVGFAAKGPIGIPTQINSWKEFLDTFGKPLNGKYSGLAVKNFLTAGGSVLFYRLADETASQSNYIVKNPVEAADGSVSFARSTDILAKEDGYFGGSIYTVKAAIKKEASPEGQDQTKWKYFYIRTPEEGRKLTQESVVRQISEQLAATPATYEAVLKNPNDVEEGFYGFKLSGTGYESSGDMYIETIENQSKKGLFQTIKDAINYGKNATVEIELDGNTTKGESVKVISLSDDLKTVITGVKKFNIKKNEKENTVTIDFSVGEEETLTLKDIAKKIDDKIRKSYNIRAFAVEGAETTGSKIVFISMSQSLNDSFDIVRSSMSTDGELFVNQQNSNPGSEFNEGDGLTNKYLQVIKYTTVKNTIPAKVPSIKFDEVTSNIILNTTETGNAKKISLANIDYANKELMLSSGVITNSYAIDGQDALDINVERNETTKKVTFSNKNNIEPPVVEKLVEGDKTFYNKSFKNLLDIEKKPGVIGGTGLDAPVVGHIAEDASGRDKVIFFSKEFGSGTNNIDVEIYTAINPTNEKDIKHNLTVYVDGIIKESFEDISLIPNNEERYFKNVISKDVEEGGSKYVWAKDDPKGNRDNEIMLPDGRYKIGRPNNSNDKKKPDDVPFESYNEYDYSVGKDGIPNEEDSYLLFEEAMKPGVSKLANKELYDFHILIAPDNITEPVQNACIDLCEDRGDAVTIVDPPQGLSKKLVIDWHNGKLGGENGRIRSLNSNYAATYWPWCKIYDNTSEKSKFAWVMPSVIMAAQYARVDKTAGCHIAPAGETNGVIPVIDIEQYPNPLDRDELYVEYNRINPITKFKDGTIVVYGEKTTQRQNSVLTKIHTRRMLVQIKKQCREALRGYIFMPNTADYLGKISNNIIAILEGYKAKGGLNFYKVVCDETNNPIEIRQQDIINVDVVLVPEGTIEQINISLTLNKTAETVTD